MSSLSAIPGVSVSERDVAPASAVPCYPGLPGSLLPQRSAPCWAAGGRKDPAGPLPGGGGGGQPDHSQRTRGKRTYIYTHINMNAHTVT